MTNKNRALESLNIIPLGSINLGDCVTLSNAREAIELATKTDWFYPSKGQYPKVNENIITDKNVVCYWDGYTVIYTNLNTDYLLDIDDITAWAYLPKFEEND